MSSLERHIILKMDTARSGNMSSRRDRRRIHTEMHGLAGVLSAKRRTIVKEDFLMDQLDKLETSKLSGIGVDCTCSFF